MSEVIEPRAGWYIDPDQQEFQRYWDGTQWTERTAPAPSTAPPAPPTPPISADPMHATAAANSSTARYPAASGYLPLAQFSPTPQDALASPQGTTPQFAAEQSQPTASQQSASESRPSRRRIGRGTIVIIFVGAIIIVIGGSILLNGGLPS